MSCSCSSENIEVTAGSTFGLAARVNFLDGSYPLIADITSITYTVTDITDEDDIVVITDADELAVADVWFDTLQTDDFWTDEKDSTGYNFLFKTSLPTADTVYSVAITISYDSGDTTVLKWKQINAI